MAELNGKQLLFVAEYIKTNNATKAAINAGYSPRAAEVQGHRLLSNAKIQERIKAAQADIQGMFAKEALSSIKTILQLRDTAENETVRLKAAQDILDRAGFKPKEKVEHSGEVNTKNEQQYHVIQELVNSDEEVADRLLSAFRGRSNLRSGGEG